MEENISKVSIDAETNKNSSLEIPMEAEGFGDKQLHETKMEDLPKPPAVDYEAIGEFCFESDMLALKGNNDYKNILEAIVILEAQREKAVTDLDVLVNLKKEALDEPFDFVERLKKNKNFIPTAQRVHPVPSIDWGKYALTGDPTAFRCRQLARIAADVRKNCKRKLDNAVETQNTQSEYWSPEEEKYLEELLVRFPPEKDEMARWEKIADCFENHTASQVAIKAKKCFAKLVQSGSVFSERIPSGIYSKKKKHTVSKGVLQQQPELNPDNGYQESLSPDDDSMDSKVDISEDEGISPELQDTAEYQELLLYKRLLRKKIRSSNVTQHLGYKCAWCKSEPIVGVRYHCVKCTSPSMIDFCEDCVGGSYEIGQHTADHQLEEIHHSKAGFVDRDYMHFLGNDYNYLDPNYMPAT